MYQTNNQSISNKDTYIALLEKQKEFLISVLLEIININIKNKIDEDMILVQLKKNIGHEKEKFVKEILNMIQDNKNNYIYNNINKTINLRYKNTTNNHNYLKNNYILAINNFKFQILANKISKATSKNNKFNNNFFSNSNEKIRDKKEQELLKKINEMLVIIKKKKDILKYRKNNLSFRASVIKEEK